MGSFMDKLRMLFNSNSEGPDPAITHGEKQGGVIRIFCTKNGRYLIQAVPNISLSQRMFDLSKRTYSGSIRGIEADWARYGPESFYFEVMKVVPRPAGMNDKEYFKILSETEREISQEEDPAMLYNASDNE